MAYATWLSPSKTTGSGNDTVSFSATNFTGRVARTTTATVTTTAGGTVSKELSVTQSAVGNVLTITAPGTIAAAGGSVDVQGTSNSTKLTIGIDNNSAFSISAPKYSVDGGTTWKDLTSGTAIASDPGATATYKFKVTVTATANGTVSSRTATLTVTPAEGTAKTQTITQTAGSATLSLDKTSITIVAAGTGQNVTITSNTSWSIS